MAEGGWRYGAGVGVSLKREANWVARTTSCPGHPTIARSRRRPTNRVIPSAMSSRPSPLRPRPGLGGRRGGIRRAFGLGLGEVRGDHAEGERLRDGGVVGELVVEDDLEVVLAGLQPLQRDRVAEVDRARGRGDLDVILEDLVLPLEDRLLASAADLTVLEQVDAEGIAGLLDAVVPGAVVDEQLLVAGQRGAGEALVVLEAGDRPAGDRRRHGERGLGVARLGLGVGGGLGAVADLRNLAGPGERGEDQGG